MLSRWSTARKLACSICMEKTKAFKLKFGGKNSWFDCLWQFLPIDHVFRRNKDSFYKIHVKRSNPPPRLSDVELFERVKKVTQILDWKVDHDKIEGYGVTQLVQAEHILGFTLLEG
ncbi:hypothetical protein ACH5RR_023654 [Cinchona calisaya]|uniref:Uncharacterized protein n=1 Tax=Cinchona calisaya TaxID=153742 RepID=A0ABD2ZF56_9GENT